MGAGSADTPTHPRMLGMADAVRERRSRLALDHMSLLNLYAAALREEGRGFVPDFDPLDGGTAAKVLFLMEKPGPMTDGTALARRIGSGFISRDNDDPTAEAIFRFAESARLARERSILWNIVPWWNGTRTIGKGELQAGLARLEALIELLPNLQVVIAVGRRAERAKRVVEFR
ncbi:MAG: hypothetical protein RLZZ528_399, partial [Pseudomonadota bacterium]